MKFTCDDAALVWFKSDKVFLKIQRGDGSNSDDAEYFLWSTFAPGEIDIDEELDMGLADSGAVYFDHNPTLCEAFIRCAEDAGLDSENTVKIKEV